MLHSVGNAEVDSIGGTQKDYSAEVRAERTEVMCSTGRHERGGTGVLSVKECQSAVVLRIQEPNDIPAEKMDYMLVYAREQLVERKVAPLAVHSTQRSCRFTHYLFFSQKKRNSGQESDSETNLHSAALLNQLCTPCIHSCTYIDCLPVTCSEVVISLWKFP